MNTSKTIAGRELIAPQAVKIAKELESVQGLMPISKEDKAKLRESIKKHGVKDAIRGYYKGSQFYLLSGLNRIEIAKELGIDLLPCEVLELKPKDRTTYAIDENLARRQLSRTQKQALIDYLLGETPNASSRAIAKKVGTDHKTVETRRRLKTTGEFPQLKRQGVDGKTRAIPKRKGETLPGLKAVIDMKKSKATLLDRRQKKQSLRDALFLAISQNAAGLSDSEIIKEFEEALYLSSTPNKETPG